MFRKIKARGIRAGFTGAVAFMLIAAMLAGSVGAMTLAPDYPGYFEVSAGRAVEPSEAQDLEEGLTAAITAVRRHFNIDESIFTEFSWNFWPGDGFFSPDSWALSWNSSDWRASIHAQVMSDGTVLHYSQHEWSPEANQRHIRLAEVSQAEARRIANAFLGDILASESGRFRLASQSLGFPSDRHNLTYVLTHNGFDHTNYVVSVSVDKLSGEVIGFWRSGHAFFHDLSQDIFSYQDASSTISRSEALAAYLEHIGMDLVYSSHFDWQTRELTVRPVYRLAQNWNQFISAVDGSLVDIDHNIHPAGAMLDGFGGGLATAMAEEASFERERRAAAAGDMWFSPAEQAAIDGVSGLISSGEALAAIIDAFGIDVDPADLSRPNLHTWLAADHINQEQYIWHISFSTETDWYSGSVDARNGTITNFGQSSMMRGMWMWGLEEPETLLYTHDEAKAIVIDKIRELSPHDFDANFQFVDRSSWFGIMPLDAGDKSSAYSFSFARTANGLRFDDNGIFVSFDNTTGAITSYSLSWFENVTFPAVNNVITPADALERVAAFSDFSIIYLSDGMTEDGRINVSLVYTFEQWVTVDPFTGDWIDWRFERITPADVSPPNYQDLVGHWSERIVNILTENGIYVWGGDAFSPDTGITRGELLRFLSFYINNPWMFTEIESSIFVNPNAAFRNAQQADGTDADSIITKQQAMQLIAAIAGYAELGRHYEIFVYPFTDDGSDAQYRGYIAILKALGIIRGDGSGNFNARNTLTRAEAAAIIYNIIMAFQ